MEPWSSSILQKSLKSSVRWSYLGCSSVFQQDNENKHPSKRLKKGQIPTLPPSQSCKMYWRNKSASESQQTQLNCTNSVKRSDHRHNGKLSRSVSKRTQLRWKVPFTQIFTLAYVYFWTAAIVMFPEDLWQIHERVQMQDACVSVIPS